MPELPDIQMIVGFRRVGKRIVFEMGVELFLGLHRSQ